MDFDLVEAQIHGLQTEITQIPEDLEIDATPETIERFATISDELEQLHQELRSISKH